MKRLVLPLLLLVAGCETESTTLSLAYSTEEPAPTIAASVSQLLESGGLELESISQKSSAEAVELVLRGEADIAIVEEPESPMLGLITITPLYPSVLHILHTRGDMAGNLASLLRGSNVYAGPVGGSAYRLLMQLAVDVDLRDTDFVVLDNPWTTVPDVYFVFGGLLAPGSLEQLDGYRLFDFRSSDDVPGGTLADGIAFRHHHVRPFLIPKGVYPTLSGQAVLTLSTRTVLIARDDLDPELAFEIASTLFANAQEISREYPLVTTELNEEVHNVDLMLPLHPGTRRYLDRDRPGFIERNVDVIALYVTLVLAAGSGLLALYRHRKQVRKDRVDVYTGKLLSVRNDMAGSSFDPKACKAHVLGIQKEVLDLLIDERIAADSSLIAFLSLSNQILEELNLEIADQANA